jgi:outer membrane protein assembly factor BamB
MRDAKTVKSRCSTFLWVISLGLALGLKMPSSRAGTWPALGPYVRFSGPDSALVQWETATNSPSILEYGTTALVPTRLADATPKTVHSIRLAGLAPKTKYYYRVRQVIGGQETASDVVDFETDFNCSVAPLPEGLAPYPDDQQTRWYSRVAQAILQHTGATKGYCLDFDCVEGRLAYELARQSELRVVGVASAAAAIGPARQSLQAAGVYGSRITLIQGSLKNLPFTKDCFNLVVSSAVLAGGAPSGEAGEIQRLLRPGGGVALFGLPPGITGSLAQWQALDAWVRGGVSTNAAAIVAEPGRMVLVRRAALAGGGQWSHAYGDAAQTTCSQDQRVMGRGLKLQWFGEPGARGITDRQARNPPALAVNGFFYVQGNNRVWALDAYNGAVYWSLEIPNLRRVNIPRDASNMCADESSLYLAVRDRCWRLDGYTGQLKQSYPVPAAGAAAAGDWGCLALLDESLLGSSVKTGSAYTAFDGGPYWYDSIGSESTAKVCSDNLFCLAKGDGQPRWSYRHGVIVNSTVAAGGGRVYFLESRTPGLGALATGRIASADLYKNNYLVALEAGAGALLWEKPITLPAAPNQVVLYLCYADEKLVLVDSAGTFNLFCYAAADGRLVWQKAHAWSRDNHGSHMYHPVIVRGSVYLEPYAYDLSTGAVVKSGLPLRGGCSTIAASANALHYINWDYNVGSVWLWDLDTDEPRVLAGTRGSCWLTVVSAGGMAFVPATSGGCTCRFPLQASFGFAAE